MKGRIPNEGGKSKGGEMEEDDSLLTNHFQIRDYLVVPFLNFVLFSVGLEFFYTF